jgi:NTP pyrophosphatase (non-canonical NTP hydrolase)
MNPDRYQELAHVTEVKDYSDALHRMTLEYIRLEHAAKGLATEAGEFHDALKKHLFYGRPLDKENLKEELGDLMWYVALAANALGVPLSSILEANVAKLQRRYPQGFTEAAAIERADKAKG